MNIGIIGTGAFAIALASILENKNVNITMWTAIDSEYEELVNTHQNKKALEYVLDNKINFTMDIKDLVKQNDTIIIAIPAKFLDTTINLMKEYINNQEILIATKGIEGKSQMLIHNYLKQELNTNNITSISGPSFAKEVIKKEPLGLTLASENKESLDYFTNLFKDISYLTIERSDDIIGCELCGILKNIVAIFSGILDGLQVNSSTNAKFLVDASLDIQEIIHYFGGKPETFTTYAGMGDLILTCTSIKSRNYTFGKLIGEGKDFNSYKQNTTIEGLENLNAIYKLFKLNNINSGIINTLYKIIYLNEPKEIIYDYLLKN